MMLLATIAVIYVRTGYEDSKKKQTEEAEGKKAGTSGNGVNFQAVMDIGRERAKELKELENAERKKE